LADTSVFIAREGGRTLDADDPWIAATAMSLEVPL